MAGVGEVGTRILGAVYRNAFEPTTLQIIKSKKIGDSVAIVNRTATRVLVAYTSPVLAVKVGEYMSAQNLPEEVVMALGVAYLAVASYALLDGVATVVVAELQVITNSV